MGGANDPLRPSAAQKVIQRIASTGACSFSRHAAEQLRKRNLTTVDCLNTLAAGVVRPAEWENGTWPTAWRATALLSSLQLNRAPKFES